VAAGDAVSLYNVISTINTFRGVCVREAVLGAVATRVEIRKWGSPEKGVIYPIRKGDVPKKPACQKRDVSGVALIT